MKSVEEIIKAMPPEDRLRLQKMANIQKKDIKEEALFILEKGANTRSLLTVLAGANAVLFF
jgi:hypothetical protein